MTSSKKSSAATKERAATPSCKPRTTRSIDVKQSENVSKDIVTDTANALELPLEEFRRFGATESKSRNQPSVQVNVYDGSGRITSYCTVTSDGAEIFPYRGKPTGVFLPGKTPCRGETWFLAKGLVAAVRMSAMGLNACGIPADSVTSKFADLFHGCDIVLVPDLIRTAEAGTTQSTKSLQGIARTIRVAKLSLHGTPVTANQISNVLRSQEGQQLLSNAIERAQRSAPQPSQKATFHERPEVVLSVEYQVVTEKVIEHLGKLGWESLWIPRSKRESRKVYQRGGELVEIVADDQKGEGQSFRIRQLPKSQICLRISEAVDLIREVEGEDGVQRKKAPPPQWLVDGTATYCNYGRCVRPLSAVVTAPTLRPDGTVLASPGYDASTALIYRPTATYPPVPDTPSQADAVAAAQKLLDVVSDFPFSSAADKAAWLALVLTLLARPAISGPVPMFVVNANSRGAGKTLLVDTANIIATGQAAARQVYTSDDNEMQKLLTSIAIEARALCFFDNIDQPLGGAPLDAALTATCWSGRILQTSQTTGSLPWQTTMICTGNNISYRGDTSRRVLSIKLESLMERPEERENFTHTDLLKWVRHNRAELVCAALTILRAYFAAGRPPQPGGAWGSFASWSEVVRAALVWCGCDDPQLTRLSAQQVDQSAALVQGLITAIRELDQAGEGLTARQMVDRVLNQRDNDRIQSIHDFMVEFASKSGTIDSTKLGYHLRRYNGRVAAGWQIVGMDAHAGVKRWKVKQVSAEDCNAPATATPVSPASAPPAIRSVDGRACQRCGTEMVACALAVNGFRNYDCPACGHVTPVHEAAIHPIDQARMPDQAMVCF